MRAAGSEEDGIARYLNMRRREGATPEARDFPLRQCGALSD